MKSIAKLHWVAAALLSCWLACNHPQSDSDPLLKAFATQKHQQTEELAAKLHLEVQPDVREFYRVAEAGDWNAVSNMYARIQRHNGQTNSVLCLPDANVLSVPLHETYGTYATFIHWDRTLLEEYANGILQSLPKGSVYFGGTDPGRFVITAFRDVLKAPDIFVVTPKFSRVQYGPVIAGDLRQVGSIEMGSGYLDYLQLLYGERLSIPSNTDRQAILRQYIQEFQSRRIRGEPIDPDEGVAISDGRVQIQGAKAAMNINGALTQWIFEHNKDKHEFYIEESYVIPWMFPYLEPHGLILKVNKEPVAQLDPVILTRDREYWDALSKTLLADARFRDNKMARKIYSKMRSAIGGVYGYRKLYEDAEYAYRQSIQLCPDSPEANFRTSQLLLETGRHGEAIQVLESYQKLDPSNPKIGLAIQQICSVKQTTADIQQLEKQLADQLHDFKLVVQLAEEYFRVQQFGRIQSLFDNFIAPPDTTAGEMLQIAQFYLSVNQPALAVRTIEQATQRFPHDADPFYALAVIQVARGATNETLTALQHAIEIFPAVRERARNDQQFAPLRADAHFQTLVTNPEPVKR